MPKFTTHAEIVAGLEQLGYQADNARSLAAEQLKSGIRHLETASFMKIVSSFLCSLENPERLRLLQNSSEEELRYDTLARTQRRLVMAGAEPLDILTLARSAQIEFLHQLLSLTDNVADYDGYPISAFNLYTVDEETNEPDVLLDGLHECVSAYII